MQNINYFTFFLISIFVIACNQGVNDEDFSEMHVGDIKFNSKLDPTPSSFKTCNEWYSYQYYNFESNGLKYKGEKPQLVKEINDAYQINGEGEDGFISIRFVVNCEGNSGYYRVSEMDNDYMPKSFSKNLSSSLLKAVQKLDGWQIKRNSRGKAVDYHQYLTFHIVNNEITSIVP